MRTPTRIALIVALVAGLASCDDPLSPEPAFVIRTTLNSVSIHNTADEQPLFTYVIDEDAVLYTDWAPCVEDGCGRIAPNGVRTLTAGEIGSGLGQWVHVYTWRRTSGPADEPIPGRVTMHRVRLSQVIDP